MLKLIEVLIERDKTLYRQAGGNGFGRTTAAQRQRSKNQGYINSVRKKS
jgi:hypothetical protein